MGLPPVDAYDGGNPGPCIVSLINTIWTLLYHRQDLVDCKRDLEQKITVLTNECDYVKVRLVISNNAYNNRIGCVCNTKKVLLIDFINFKVSLFFVSTTYYSFWIT